MFTPPPSPDPLATSNRTSVSPPSLFISTPESQSDYPFPRMNELSPKSPQSAEPGVPPKTPHEVKKQTGRWILLLVVLLPAALILSASFRHILLHFRHDVFPPVLLQKRYPQDLIVTSDTSTISTDSPAASTSPSTTIAATTPTPSTPDTTLPTIPTDPQLPIPFPQPFDASLPANFSTNGCLSFFQQFMQAENFRQCRAVSFLLNASSAFLSGQRNLTLFNNIIAGTCNTVPSTDTCQSTMDSYLSQFNNDCAEDIAKQNPIVLQTQIGFQSYVAMRTAACLSDDLTNQYCYIEALGQTNPADIYAYALPLGTPIPNGVTLSCSPCLKSVLSVYADYVNPGSGTISISSFSGNSTASNVHPQPLPILSKTYPSAAHLAVAQCGGTFASVTVAQQNSATRYSSPWTKGFMVGVAIGSWVIYKDL